MESKNEIKGVFNRVICHAPAEAYMADDCFELFVVLLI